MRGADVDRWSRVDLGGLMAGDGGAQSEAACEDIARCILAALPMLEASEVRAAVRHCANVTGAPRPPEDLLACVRRILG